MSLPELNSAQLALNPTVGGAATLRAWANGQILQATVVRQTSEGTVTLRIGNQEMQARTGLRLAVDQPLTLQVAQSGTQTVLRILHASNLAATPNLLATHAAATPISLEPGILTRAWRQVLPRSGELSPLLGQLTQLADPAQSTSLRSLPAPVIAALRQFAARLPSIEALSNASGLRRAMDDSGLFLESRLADALSGKAPAALQNDLKANLLQLVATVRTLARPGQAPTPAGTPAMAEPDPAVASILRQADAALARIEQQQLATLANSAAPVMQLPVYVGPQLQLLELRIEHDQAGAGATASQAQWNVWLSFHFDELGSVQARVTLTPESVSIGLWAEQTQTATLFEQHLGELDSALRLAGLTPAGLKCHAGPPPHPEKHNAPNRLLDERA